MLLLASIFAAPAQSAVIYLRSGDGDDGDDGLTWANAKATLAAAITAAGSGGTIYVSDNHAETQSSAMTLNSPGTVANPLRVICVDDAGNPEPPTSRATTATVTTTGANAITFTTSSGGTNYATYIYGVTFNCGTGSSAASIVVTSTGYWQFDTCALKLLTTSGSSIFNYAPSPLSGLELINTALTFSHASQTFRAAGYRVLWRDTASAIAGTAPNILFSSENDVPGLSVQIRDVDLSALTGILVNQSGRTANIFELQNCKLGSGVTLAGALVDGPLAGLVRVINCDSADTNYRYLKRDFGGTITQETTIVRTGGATDGTTPVSRKMVTAANAKWYIPLVSDPILVWVDSLAQQTVTVDTITDNVTLTDAEAWVDVEYAGTNGFPLYVTASDRIADPIFGTPANQTNDSNSTWTTTGLTIPVEQELSVTFTPQEKGWYYVRVNLAKASTTMYFCPQVSGAKASMLPGGYVNMPHPSGAPIIGGGIVR